jgi:hypothetical protein
VTVDGSPHRSSGLPRLRQSPIGTRNLPTRRS